MALKWLSRSVRASSAESAPGASSTRQFMASMLYNFQRRLEGLNTTGVQIDERTALSLPAAFASVNTISTDLASMPLRLVQEMDDGRAREAKEHPAYATFRRSPDDQTTPMRFRQAWLSHALTYGDGYAEIVRSIDGKRIYLYLINPETTQIIPHREPAVGPSDGVWTIRYNANGVMLDKEQVLHLAGLGYNGLQGYGLVRMANQTFGLGLGADRFGGAFLGNGAATSGFIKSSAELTDDAVKEMREAFDERHAGTANAGRIGVLPPGFDFQSTASKPKDAQLTELRGFQVLECARLWRVPPHKLGDYSNASYSSIEAANLEYLQMTLLPWAEAVEQTLNLRLLTAAEQANGFTFKHDFRSMMRADAAGRAALIQVLGNLGAVTRNEIRAGEGYEPLDDPTANQPLVPLNMAPGSAKEAA
jgi:HK97 family phage portal protein